MTVGIIQARLGSKRLPNKMLLSLHGKPIIEWVIRRVQKSKLLDKIIVAIPDTLRDNLLEYYCRQYGVDVFRGSENDVLSRFYEAAILTKAKWIVRICADNPLIDPMEIDNLVSFYESNKCDYAYNHIPIKNKYPDGIGAEIVPFDILKFLAIHAKRKEEREHPFTYISNNKDDFVIKTFDPPDKSLHHPELRFDVDTFDDYKKLHSFNFNINDSSSKLIKLFTRK